MKDSPSSIFGTGPETNSGQLPQAEEPSLREIYRAKQLQARGRDTPVSMIDQMRKLSPTAVTSGSNINKPVSVKIEPSTRDDKLTGIAKQRARLAGVGREIKLVGGRVESIKPLDLSVSKQENNTAQVQHQMESERMLRDAEIALERLRAELTDAKKQISENARKSDDFIVDNAQTGLVEAADLESAIDKTVKEIRDTERSLVISEKATDGSLPMNITEQVLQSDRMQVRFMSAELSKLKDVVTQMLEDESSEVFNIAITKYEEIENKYKKLSEFLDNSSLPEQEKNDIRIANSYALIKVRFDERRNSFIQDTTQRMGEYDTPISQLIGPMPRPKDIDINITKEEFLRMLDKLEEEFRRGDLTFREAQVIMAYMAAKAEEFFDPENVHSHDGFKEADERYTKVLEIAKAKLDELVKGEDESGIDIKADMEEMLGKDPVSEMYGGVGMVPDIQSHINSGVDSSVLYSNVLGSDTDVKLDPITIPGDQKAPEEVLEAVVIESQALINQMREEIISQIASEENIGKYLAFKLLEFYDQLNDLYTKKMGIFPMGLNYSDFQNKVLGEIVTDSEGENKKIEIYFVDDENDLVQVEFNLHSGKDIQKVYEIIDKNNIKEEEDYKKSLQAPSLTVIAPKDTAPIDVGPSVNPDAAAVPVGTSATTGTVPEPAGTAAPIGPTVAAPVLPPDETDEDKEWDSFGADISDIFSDVHFGEADEVDAASKASVTPVAASPAAPPAVVASAPVVAAAPVSPVNIEFNFERRDDEIDNKITDFVEYLNSINEQWDGKHEGEYQKFKTVMHGMRQDRITYLESLQKQISESESEIANLTGRKNRNKRAAIQRKIVALNSEYVDIAHDLVYYFGVKNMNGKGGVMIEIDSGVHNIRKAEELTFRVLEDMRKEAIAFFNNNANNEWHDRLLSKAKYSTGPNKDQFTYMNLMSESDYEDIVKSSQSIIRSSCIVNRDDLKNIGIGQNELHFYKDEYNRNFNFYSDLLDRYKKTQFKGNALQKDLWDQEYKSLGKFLGHYKGLCHIYLGRFLAVAYPDSDEYKAWLKEDKKRSGKEARDAIEKFESAEKAKAVEAWDADPVNKLKQFVTEFGPKIQVLQESKSRGHVRTMEYIELKEEIDRAFENAPAKFNQVKSDILADLELAKDGNYVDQSTQSPDATPIGGGAGGSGGDGGGGGEPPVGPVTGGAAETPGDGRELSRDERIKLNIPEDKLDKDTYLALLNQIQSMITSAETRLIMAQEPEMKKDFLLDIIRIQDLYARLSGSELALEDFKKIEDVDASTPENKRKQKLESLNKEIKKRNEEKLRAVNERKELITKKLESILVKVGGDLASIIEKIDGMPFDAAMVLLADISTVDLDNPDHNKDITKLAIQKYRAELAEMSGDYKKTESETEAEYAERMKKIAGSGKLDKASYEVIKKAIDALEKKVNPEAQADPYIRVLDDLFYADYGVPVIKKSKDEYGNETKINIVEKVEGKMKVNIDYLRDLNKLNLYQANTIKAIKKKADELVQSIEKRRAGLLGYDLENDEKMQHDLWQYMIALEKYKAKLQGGEVKKLVEKMERANNNADSNEAKELDKAGLTKSLRERILKEINEDSIGVDRRIEKLKDKFKNNTAARVWERFSNKFINKKVGIVVLAAVAGFLGLSNAYQLASNRMDQEANKQTIANIQTENLKAKAEDKATIESLTNLLKEQVAKNSTAQSNDPVAQAPAPAPKPTATPVVNTSVDQAGLERKRVRDEIDKRGFEAYGLNIIRDPNIIYNGSDKDSNPLVHNIFRIKDIKGDFRRFASPEDGLLAGLHQLEYYKSNASDVGINSESTVRQMLIKYANLDGDNRKIESYTKAFTAAAKGVSLDSKLKEVEIKKIAAGIINAEQEVYKLNNDKLVRLTPNYTVKAGAALMGGANYANANYTFTNKLA